MSDLRLVIFDVDGTLVDSQRDILAAMQAAFEAVDAPLPARDVVLGVVGLSLDTLFPVIAPERSEAAHREMSAAYKSAYMRLRAEKAISQSSPLYPGALETLHRLNAFPEVLLGVATGKSRRGLDKLIEGHGLEGLFVTQQVADFHPSKPHPSMILQAMAEAGVGPSETVMIGDTSFDMEMARAAGVTGIGAGWGYHARDRLNDATVIADDFAGLAVALDRFCGVAA